MSRRRTPPEVRRQQKARAQRRYQQRLKETGGCRRCGRPREDPRATACYCGPCTAKFNAAMAARRDLPGAREAHRVYCHERYERLRTIGRCVRCAVPRGEGGTSVLCARCHAKDRASYHRRVALRRAA